VSALAREAKELQGKSNQKKEEQNSEGKIVTKLAFSLVVPFHKIPSSVSSIFSWKGKFLESNSSFNFQIDNDIPVPKFRKCLLYPFYS